MRRLCILVFATLLSIWFGPSARAETKGASAPHIEWEVKNRFRLFRNEADFQRHVAAQRGDGVLAADSGLARASDGRGWARDTVERLCVDRPASCSSSASATANAKSILRRAIIASASRSWHQCRPMKAAPGASMTATARRGRSPAPATRKSSLRVRYGRHHVGERRHRAAGRHGATAGQRDPGARRAHRRHGRFDRGRRRQSRPRGPASDEGFCFRRFDGGEYYRPGRAGFSGNKSCNAPATIPGSSDWARQGARWMSGACHRSLYSYQMRTALALAVENPHIAVTFIPLGCSGATINVGFLDGQRARECPAPAPAPPVRARSRAPGRRAERHPDAARGTAPIAASISCCSRSAPTIFTSPG